MTTCEMMRLVEEFGYQFLKDKRGWACYDADTRLEVPGSRHEKFLGESVFRAYNTLMKEK